jgi:hypothetical protein
MWVLQAKEMESSSKINLKDVLWCMSIKDAYKLGVLIIVNFQKNGTYLLVMGGNLSQTTQTHD